MKLEKILDKLGSIEKNSFIKIIDNIISKNPKNIKEIEKILISADKGLKSVDNQNISNILGLIFGFKIRRILIKSMSTFKTPYFNYFICMNVIK